MPDPTAREWETAKEVVRGISSTASFSRAEEIIAHALAARSAEARAEERERRDMAAVKIAEAEWLASWEDRDAPVFPGQFDVFMDQKRRFVNRFAAAIRRES